jgi:hypothetical protein
MPGIPNKPARLCLWNRDGRESPAMTLLENGAYQAS